MTLQSFRATAAAATVLTVGWIGVMLGISSQLPSGEDPEDRYLGTNATHWKRTMPLHVNRANPCTGGPITVDATLALDVIAQVEGESAQVDVTATLTGSESTNGSAQIAPLRERFGFSAPLYGEPTTIRPLRTLLVGQPSPITLTVALQHRVGETDKLIVEPSNVWLTCGNDPVEVSRADLSRSGQPGS